MASYLTFDKNSEMALCQLLIHGMGESVAFEQLSNGQPNLHPVNSDPVIRACRGRIFNSNSVASSWIIDIKSEVSPVCENTAGRGSVFKGDPSVMHDISVNRNSR